MITSLVYKLSWPEVQQKNVKFMSQKSMVKEYAAIEIEKCVILVVVKS